MEYPPDRKGSIERVDKPAADEDQERVIGVVWSEGSRRTITIVRRNGEALLRATGTAGDLTRWWDLPGLKGYAIFAMDINGTHTPRAGIGAVMIVTLMVQKLDSGQQEEPWNFITDFPYDDRQ